MQNAKYAIKGREMLRDACKAERDYCTPSLKKRSASVERKRERETEGASVKERAGPAGGKNRIAVRQNFGSAKSHVFSTIRPNLEKREYAFVQFFFLFHLISISPFDLMALET